MSSVFANINTSLHHYKWMEAFKISTVAFIILWGQLIKVGNKDFSNKDFSFHLNEQNFTLIIGIN